MSNSDRTPSSDPSPDEGGDGTASDPHVQAEHPPPPAEPGGGAPDDPDDDDPDDEDDPNEP